MPSTCTVQAPHCPIPQPNLVPVSLRCSRNTQSSGVAGSVSTSVVTPLTVNEIIVFTVYYRAVGLAYTIANSAALLYYGLRPAKKFLYGRCELKITSPGRIPLVIVCLTFVSAASFAHHSVAGFYDPKTQIEIEGVIKSVRWRNPHIVFNVDVTSNDGEVVTWRIESGALGVLRQRGLAREFVQPGDHVKIRGDSSLRSDHEMFARNMLLQNGKEVVLTAGSRPYFSVVSEGEILEAVFDADVEAAARENADGIMRVWSTNIDDRSSARLKMFDGNYPLLAAAAAARAVYDLGDQTLRGCTMWTMPRLMANPLPMEFLKSGENILQRFEEDDNVRTIHMNGDVEESSVEPSALGYSKGRWAGETLIVETSRLAPERFDNHGTPFSAELQLTERFSLSQNGNRLDYVLTVSDPGTFPAPFEMRRQWDWRPEIVVGSYNCDQDQQL